ncbi:thioredoxin fold domain-containing protein [Sulfurovum riftiae]|uniref:Thioredoxin-like fold domain-containing protein n=1 Tax=Sulfurovum riftiae TaxID=1630136 RepID=A0A151CGK6_9BACT|nr:thioredoxin fold domain-containing protein [Sulfurovum riftiae]KYJ86413.1 hypothetical protein AS592_06360 [Sulfurovum riftiae]
MKHLLLAIVAIATFTGTLFSSDIIEDKTKLEALKKLNKVLEDPVLTIKAAIEKPQNYLLKIEAKGSRGSQLLTAFLDKSSSELYIGSAYDKEGKEILFPKDAETIKEGVAFSYGKGSKEIYVVTDPECPYCGRFEKAAEGKLDDYTVHIILFPLSFHKKAPVMVEWIMQGKDDAERKARFEKLMLKGSTAYKDLHKDAKKPFKYSAQTQKEMERSDKAVMELNVRGTPAIYDENFNPVSQAELLNLGKK